MKTLFVCGKVPVDPLAQLWKPSIHSGPAARKGGDPQNAMRLAQHKGKRSYRYLFEGRATVAGQPCDRANVALRPQLPTGEVEREVKTETDGSYAVEVPVFLAED